MGRLGVVSLRLSEGDVARLEALGEALDMAPATVAREALRLGLDRLETAVEKGRLPGRTLGTAPRRTRGGSKV